MTGEVPPYTENNNPKCDTCAYPFCVFEETLRANKDNIGRISRDLNEGGPAAVAPPEVVYSHLTGVVHGLAEKCFLAAELSAEFKRTS